MSARLTRRQFASLAATGLAGLTLGCRDGAASGAQRRVTARPPTRAKHLPRLPAGAKPLALGEPRDAILMIPAGAPAGPLPLLVLLHGAGGNGGNMLRRLGAAVDAAGIAVLAPDSRDPRTWDAVIAAPGPDIAFINRALERVYDSLDVDPTRVSVGGFSDGATYAITLGLMSGDVFSRVVAWSPGFFVDDEVNGKPRFYVSHGRRDDILPIQRCSRVIVPRLQKRGYDVTFREFDGGHAMPPDVIREGLEFAIR